MEGILLGGFPVSNGLRNAVCVSLLIGILSMSACSAEAPVALTCNENTDFVAGALDEIGSQAELKCQEGHSLHPDKASKTFCKDAACTQEIQLSDDRVSWTTATDNEQLLSRKSVDGNVLTLVEYPEKSQTLYFQCRNKKNEEVQEENRLAQTDKAPKEPCVIQVAAYGTRAAATVEEEHVCKIGNDKSVTLNSTSNKVTFRCASDADTLSTINFEEALQGDGCDQTVKLADLNLSASLVEGMSALSATNAVPYLLESPTETDLPTYTFEVAKLPKEQTVLCYKCIKKTEHESIHKSEPAKDCKFRITVPAAKPNPQGPGEDGQQESHQDPNGQTQQGDDLNPSEPDQKPDGAEKPTGSSARKSTTGVAILAVLMMFSALPYMR
ncbi:SAG-related sequence SRS55F [Toxoplasma gondii ME49]|uniref:SAG-related sequence SRS55F n=2 Tax=Toxoplasma gondii TaxID=5811 RepID=A0A125YUP9_TOXGV|nr:SAG-related sequence SRS55F [Toxoplasma gondii ME49]EPT26286.1 SAG-related sequence SRS55F [Toxoplasma gondii ME49]ESS34746.1 SAG-related sequence SRS55F [Toxoplasma gondii VEG]|eukprot:XP_018635617.1 SAG-related sequence SRS55F [Toxoplasma gondii ME49]